MQFLEVLQFLGAFALVLLASWMAFEGLVPFLEQYPERGKLNVLFTRKEFFSFIKICWLNLKSFLPLLLLFPLPVGLGGGFVATLLVGSQGTWWLGFAGGFVTWLVVGGAVLLVFYLVRWRKLRLHLPESGEDVLVRGAALYVVFLGWNFATIGGVVGWFLHRVFL